MIYLAWAIFVEGRTDVDYLSVLLPKLVEDLVANADGPLAQVPEQPVATFGLGGRRFELVSEEICRAREAIRILFVHGDTGGRAVEGGLDQRTRALCRMLGERCGFDENLCVLVTPRRETEAWCLADQTAIRLAFGLPGTYAFDELPDEPGSVERIQDPKRVAAEVLQKIKGTRRGRKERFPYAAVAQYQALDTLRMLPSFRELDGSLRRALHSLGYPNM